MIDLTPAAHLNLELSCPVLLSMGWQLCVQLLPHRFDAIPANGRGRYIQSPTLLRLVTIKIPGKLGSHTL